MNCKITSLNQQLNQLKMAEKAIDESTGLYGKAWSPDARRQLAKHKTTIKELQDEYGVDAYPWMLNGGDPCPM